MNTRYPFSVDPVDTDHRDVDCGIATLTGEAASQEVTREDRHLRRIAHEWDRRPLAPERLLQDVPPSLLM